jgi:diketogulonate reductase-like aldo/keto reductase
MQHRELDSTAIKLPEIGIGTWRYKGNAELLRHGIALGATLVDTAELYGNEAIVGQAIKGIRNKVFVATKTNHWKHDEVLRSADASLQKLGIDCIDLYQIHWSNAAVPIAETMGAMEHLVKQGKVRYIGVSNFTMTEMKTAQNALSKEKIVSNQMRYSIVERSIELNLLPYCQQQNITLIAYSPLGESFQRVLDADPKNALGNIAEKRNKSKAQIALNWCLTKPGVIAIPKTESKAHMAENCASSDWRLTPEEVALLDNNIIFKRRGPLQIFLRRVVRRGLQKIGRLK